MNNNEDEKEAAAVAELGGAVNWNPKNIGLSYGPTVAVEVTPIEKWLELELGVTPYFWAQTREWDIDLLFKKPWTLSNKVEFMFGVGLDWAHENELNKITNSLGGEIALDFMFWPSAKHRLGWYLEPGYDYSFQQGHEQSIGLNGGILIAIP